MSQSDIQHRQLRLLLRQKSCLCCCCYYISVVFQKPQAKTASKKTSSTSLKRQPAFRLVKGVFVVVHRQHRVHNQTVVPVVSVVVKREGDSLKGYTKRSGRNRGRSPRIVVRIQLPGRQYLVTLLPCYISADGEVLSYRQLPLFLYPRDCVPGYDRFA